MRGAAALACLVLAGAAHGAAPPPGATAQCADGTYSTSQHRSGTCSHHGGVARWLGGGPAAVQPRLGATVLLGRRTAHAGCRRGVLPDRRCSPGAYSTGLTRAVLCSAGFRTGSVRNVSEAEKFAVEREYGMPARPYGRTIEIDHIVPLELGGSNGIANLFPEPGRGDASYHVKDRLENRLHDLVCAGRMPLRDAQRRIATNWRALSDALFRSA